MCDISVWHGSFDAGSIRCVCPANPTRTSNKINVKIIVFFKFGSPSLFIAKKPRNVLIEWRWASGEASSLADCILTAR
jgi:hypothetical protein